MRYKLIITYNGNYVNGWFGDINNPKSIFIKVLLEKAIFSLIQEKVVITCGGRTDAGVHAIKQICHFDINKTIKRLECGLNSYLPSFIRVLRAQKVNSKFNARFSAKSRTYQYLIYNNISNSAILEKKALWVPQKLNLILMTGACNLFIGHMDFSTICPKSYMGKKDRTIQKLTIRQKTIFFHKLIVITITAKAFAHHMVRNIVSCLLKIGLQKWSIEFLQQLLEKKQHSNLITLVAAYGLYLTKISY